MRPARTRRVWRTRRARAAVAACAAAGAALAVGGCGLGQGPSTSDASEQVTENFGTQIVGQVTQKHVPGQETVMQLLQRHFTVTTKYGGGFVESIDGRSGTSNRHDWFFYVNGVEAQKGAAATPVHHADHIWWDLHDWAATDSIPAVVGSYPEPFLDGVGGQKYPTLLTCAPNTTVACNTVAHSLTKAGVKVSFQGFGTGSGSDSLAIVVGTFAQIPGVIAAELIKAGPGQSGVYAQNVGSRALELDDPLGNVVQTLRGDVGLVAATEQPSLNQPTWLVTGTDTAGVNAAARALTPQALHDKFAVATDGGRVIALPVLSR